MDPPAPALATRVLLARHGQSAWNAEGRWQGQADPPLTDLGRRQAHEAARALGALDAIWASDLQRAAQTAAIISADLGVGPVVLDPDLRERDAGEFSGLTRDEIEARFPGHLADRRRPPGWEPDEHLLARGLRVVARIAAAVPGGDVLAVTHGGLVYTLEAHLGGENLRLANLAARWLEVSGESLRLGGRIILTEPGDVTIPGQI
jgi:broad specificity phosphatase PhoE